jgi:hypothetical protein
MRRFILGTMTAAAMAVGLSSAGFAGPAFNPHEHGGSDARITNVRPVDYYWNHHHYHHRDWDRHHNRWHYYD